MRNEFLKHGFDPTIMPDTSQDLLALYLKRLELRSTLGSEERSAILSLPAEICRVDVAHDFVRIGQPVDHACLIVEGLVARFAQLRNGQRGIVALHIPGDMADLHSVVAKEVSWALHATTPSTIARIPHEALRELTRQYPAIAFAFWRDCVVDASVLAQWALNLSRKDAAARVAHLFSEMRHRYAAIGALEANGIPFPITQTNLADALGLTSIHLNRVLKRFREEAIAVKTPDKVEIYNAPRLAALGEFDDAYLQCLPDPQPAS